MRCDAVRCDVEDAHVNRNLSDVPQDVPRSRCFALGLKNTQVHATFQLCAGPPNVRVDSNRLIISQQNRSLPQQNTNISQQASKKPLLCGICDIWNILFKGAKNPFRIDPRDPHIRIQRKSNWISVKQSASETKSNAISWQFVAF